MKKLFFILLTSANLYGGTTILLDDNHLKVSTYQEDIYEYDEATDEYYLIGVREDYYGILVESKNNTGGLYISNVTIPYVSSTGNILYVTSTHSGSYVHPSTAIDGYNIQFDFNNVFPHNQNLAFDSNDKFYYLFSYNGEKLTLNEPIYTIIPEPSCIFLGMIGISILFKRNKH
jgi:hypothetical protein